MCEFFCSDQVEIRGQFVGSLSLFPSFGTWDRIPGVRFTGKCHLLSHFCSLCIVILYADALSHISVPLRTHTLSALILLVLFPPYTFLKLIH